MKDESCESSEAQRSWELIAREVRVELRKLIPLIPSMKPEELKPFIESLDSAQWMEFKAMVLDKRVDLELMKVTD